MGVTETATQVQRGETSAVDVAQTALASAAAHDASLHAFLYVARDAALAEARAVDAKRARGEALGPLAGVPVAVKDAICTRGIPTTAGSRILENWTPPYDATVVERLRAADAVIVGKTNMDEFAMGSSNENSAFGPAKNPYDLARTPGGSSGGSAAAVSARIVPCALGSDTGGSIRQPAAFTGVVGVKPTYGRVSRYGLVAFASSLDQIGPIAADVRGAARVLSVIAGHDPRDATSLDAPVGDFEAACGRSVRGLRIGVPDEYFRRGLDPEVHANVLAAMSDLESEGCVVKQVSLPHTPYAVATYYVLATAEASSNLARYDGVRYGLRVEELDQDDVRAMIGATRDAGFGAEVKRRILLGTFVLSAGYYDAYYAQAQRVRTLVRRDFEDALRDVDVLCSPTTPTPAFLLGEKTADPLAMYLSDVYTLPASLAGFPAMSVPAMPTSSGLPVGLQIVGRPLDEETMFAVAAAWESR
jgi:aspartyl-tRNA(Asn)/glutamyl-tRNA(Gln) amidotransferase subunit A